MTDIVERLGVLAASLANPQVTVDAQREIARLRAERDTFYMDYRIKCDEETKQLEADLAAAKAVIENIVVSEVEPLKALLREAFAQRHRVLSDWPDDLQDRIRAALGDSE